MSEEYKEFRENEPTPPVNVAEQILNMAGIKLGSPYRKDHLRLAVKYLKKAKLVGLAREIDRVITLENRYP